MLKTFLVAAVAPFLSLAAIAQAQNNPGAPVGLWRCIVNSPVVSIDLQMQVAPDGSLFGRGSIVYVNTGRIYQVHGPGDWSLLPPATEAPGWLYKFRMAPQNHAIFSWFAGPTQSQGLINNVFYPPGGGVVETTCQRIG